MSVDLSGEITAIATAVLAFFAIVAAVFSFLAYRRQTQEVDVLLEQKDREVVERRRAQAAHVFVGLAPSGTNYGAVPANASDFPIYDARVWYLDWLNIHENMYDDIGTVLPSEEISPVGGRIFDSAGEVLSLAILTFRDAAGATWVRTPEGVLTECLPNDVKNAVQAACAMAAREGCVFLRGALFLGIPVMRRG